MLNITITAYSHSWGAYAIFPYLFPAFKSAVVFFIGIFCSTKPPPIMISSLVHWCSRQPMNGVCQELNPPLPFSNVYIVNNFPRQILTKLQ